MKCPYPDCSGQIVEGQRFCNICGRPVDPQSVAAAMQAANSAPPSQPLPPYQAPPYGEPPYQVPPYANQPYGNQPQYPPPQYPPPQYQQYPPQQMPPTQPYAQGQWQGQPYAQVPMQQVAPRRGSSVPLALFLLLVLVGGGVAVWYFVFGGKLPSFGGPTSSITPTVGTATFHFVLPVYERDNNYQTEPIRGLDGQERRLSVFAGPYESIGKGSSVNPAKMAVSLKAANTENLTAEQIFKMEIMFTTSQELADEMTAYSESKYPGYIDEMAFATKGKSVELTDEHGWKMKVTVDEVTIENGVLGDGSPYPIFTRLDLTVELTPK